MPPHVLAHVGPHGQQDALTLVFTGTVLVRPPEVAGHDGTVDGAHDLSQGDVPGGSGQDVPTAHATLRADQARPLEGEKDLLELGLGETGPLRDVAHRRRRRFAGAQSERQQCPAGVVAPRRYLHVSMVRREPSSYPIPRRHVVPRRRPVPQASRRPTPAGTLS